MLALTHAVALPVVVVADHLVAVLAHQVVVADHHVAALDLPAVDHHVMMTHHAVALDQAIMVAVVVDAVHRVSTRLIQIYRLCSNDF